MSENTMMKSPFTISRTELNIAVELARPLSMTDRDDYSIRGLELVVRMSGAETVATLRKILADAERVESALKRITR